jgi:hypothetical protein
MRLKLLGRVVLVLCLPLMLSGCEVLFPAFYGTGGFIGDPPYVEPSFGPDVVYSSGSATLDVTASSDKQNVVLDQLADGSTTFGMTSLVWKNSSGWSMTLNRLGGAALPDTPALGFENMLSVQRITGNDVWVADTTFNPTACRVTLDTQSSDRVHGTATCIGLRWAEGLGTALDMQLTAPRYVDGQDPFDVGITFEADAAGPGSTR